MYTAACAYEINLCIALTGGFHWVIFATLLFIDVAENAYHVLSCLRDTDLQVRHFIAAQLLLREWVEVTVPLQFLIVLLWIWNFRPANTDLFCGMSEDDFKGTLMILAIDFAIEGAVSIIAQCCMGRLGLRPVQMLRSLLSVHAHAFSVTHVACLIYFLSATNPHMGMDMTFRFSWRIPNSAWVCGSSWTSE